MLRAALVSKLIQQNRLSANTCLSPLLVFGRDKLISQEAGEPVGIDPKVDCVFKAILGDPAHSEVLVDFLNAVLAPRDPIISVEILNPFQLPTYLSEKYTVLDILAMDTKGRRFQVEMQTFNETALKPRIVFNWAQLFLRQQDRDEGTTQFQDLQPVISIWLLGQNSMRQMQHFHHCFQIRDQRSGKILTRLLEIHLLELERWQLGLTENTSPALIRWMRFFAEAKNWIEVPKEMEHPPLEVAMDVLKKFKDNGDWNEEYRAHMEARRRRATAEAEKARLLTAKSQLEREVDQLEEEKGQLEEEKGQLEEEKGQLEEEKGQLEEENDRLRARLRSLGVDPNTL
ncbi:MAG: Rpn family recombination-promoting nuclease/putative transposase [Myxococcota bacterium]